MTIEVAAHPRVRSMGGWVPYGLIALVIIPGAAGSLRLVELAGGPHLMPANPRAEAFPAPIVVHILSALTFAVLGAFQFSSVVRRRHPAWHRTAGRVLVALGLTFALSALWMTQFYPRQPGTGELTHVLRLAFATALISSIVLGYLAIRGGDVREHQAWMTRAYALALGAGTQVFTQALGQPVLGKGELANGFLMGSGWVINLVVAEVALRGRPSRAGRAGI